MSNSLDQTENNIERGSTPPIGFDSINSTSANVRDTQSNSHSLIPALLKPSGDSDTGLKKALANDPDLSRENSSIPLVGYNDTSFNDTKPPQ